MKIVRIVAVLHSTKTTKKKVVENRKTELKSIFKSFEDISKKEIERSKVLFDLHKNFFNEEETLVPVVINEDDFFKKD